MSSRTLSSGKFLTPIRRANSDTKHLTTRGWPFHHTGHLGFPHLHTLTTAGLLTPDETNLWRLIAHGTPNHRIAATLGHSPRTLSRRLPAFYQPIGATDKPHATRLCSRALHPHPHPAPRGHNTNEKYRYA